MLDDRQIPTGRREPAQVEPGPLAGRSFDDAYTDLGPHARFSVAVELLEGYDFVQVYAPADRDLVSFEPMTAPTNAIASGDGLTMLRPGEMHTAAFRISVA